MLYKDYFKIIGDEEKMNINRYFKSDDSSKYNKMNNFNESIENITKLDPFKLCIEIELLFRYLDYSQKNTSEENKRFFFSTIEEIFYNLKKIPFVDDDKNISNFLL